MLLLTKWAPFSNRKASWEVIYCHWFSFFMIHIPSTCNHCMHNCQLTWTQWLISNSDIKNLGSSCLNNWKGDLSIISFILEAPLPEPDSFRFQACNSWQLSSLSSFSFTRQDLPPQRQDQNPPWNALPFNPKALSFQHYAAEQQTNLEATRPLEQIGFQRCESIKRKSNALSCINNSLEHAWICASGGS